MIQIIRGIEAAGANGVLDEMFQARRRLFRERLGWEVQVDGRGREIDEYDALEPCYVIAVGAAGRHLGSLRLLPTTGPTMLQDHFSALMDGMTIRSPKVWECTRFCVEVDPSAGLTRRGVHRITTELMLGACEYMLGEGVSKVVAVFDTRMIRIYRRAGWPPELLGESGEGRDAVYLGLWDVSEDSARSIREASGLAGSMLEPPEARRRRPLRDDVVA